MKKNRFARLLLTGKAATLPLLIGQARADVTPTSSDMISPDLRVIEMPVSSAIRLQSIDADASSYAAAAYAGSAAYFCVNAGLPSFATVVVTGVTPGEVILAAASNKDDPFHLQIDKRLTLGTKGLSILGSASVGFGSFNSLVPVGSFRRGSVSFNLNTATLTALAVGGKFYIQAVIIPSGATTVSNWQISELDEIRVGTCDTSPPYGISSY